MEKETDAKLVTPARMRDLEDAILCVIYEWWDALPETMWMEVEDDGEA
jgi:hypothetical protein